MEEYVIKCLQIYPKKLDFCDKEDIFRHYITFRTGVHNSKIGLFIRLVDVDNESKLDLTPESWNQLLEDASKIHYRLIKGGAGVCFSRNDVEGYIQQNEYGLDVIMFSDPRVENNTKPVVMNIVAFECMCQMAKQVLLEFQKEYDHLKKSGEALLMYTKLITTKKYNSKGTGKNVVYQEIKEIEQCLQDLVNSNIPYIALKSDLTSIYQSSCLSPCIHCNLTELNNL